MHATLRTTINTIMLVHAIEYVCCAVVVCIACYQYHLSDVCLLFVYSFSLFSSLSLSQSLVIRCFVVDLYNKHKPTNLVVNNRSDTFGLACLSQLLVNHCIDY